MNTSNSAPRLSLSLKGLGKSFTVKGTTVEAVKNINIDVEEGEYIVVVGPSGCGKSTLIRSIAGLESPTTGTITLNGQNVYDGGRGVNVPVNKRNLGMVFQSYALWPHMSVEKNVAYPLRMRGVDKTQRAKLVGAVLEALECTPLAKRLPAELSGGQQQRVALARALVYEPSVLLLDEPLSNLDALLRVSLRTELLRIHRSIGYTGIHITHDQEEALEMGDRVVLMNAGAIEQMGPPAEVYSRPVSPYAAKFLGVRNSVKVRANNGRLEHQGGVIGGSGAFLTGASQGREMELFVRPRDTRIVAGHAPATTGEDVAVDGVVAQIVLGEGGRRQYLVDAGGAQWFAQHAEGGAPEVGDPVHIRVDRAQTLLYADNALITP